MNNFETLKHEAKRYGILPQEDEPKVPSNVKRISIGLFAAWLLFLGCIGSIDSGTQTGMTYFLAVVSIVTLIVLMHVVAKGE